MDIYSTYPSGFGPMRSLCKRVFDLVVAFLILPVVLPVSILLVVLSKFVHGKGIFTQIRVGQHGKEFRLHKICSMKTDLKISTTVTSDNDPRITNFGRIIRKLNLDEFPQLWNIILGDMSFVGPRPDVPETYKNLTPLDRDILSIKPGVTGLASLKFRNEGSLLAGIKNPEEFNRTVLFPKKIKINRDYIKRQSTFLDIKIMTLTVFSPLLERP